jgi:hypothetical protein
MAGGGYLQCSADGAGEARDAVAEISSEEELGGGDRRADQASLDTRRLRLATGAIALALACILATALVAVRMGEGQFLRGSSTGSGSSTRDVVWWRPRAAAGGALLSAGLIKVTMGGVGHCSATLCGAFSGCVSAVWGALTGCIGSICAGCSNLFGACWGAIGGCCGSICGALTGCLKACPLCGKCLGNFSASVGKCVGGCYGAIGNCIASVWNAAAGCIGGLCDKVAGCISSMWNSLAGCVSSCWGSLDECCMKTCSCCY